MTQPTLLELAKQGNQEAIASVMNYLLKDKGITAKAIQNDARLVVVLESAQVPEQTSSVASIHKLMMQLNLESIKSVKVYGKQAAHPSTAWIDTLNLTPKVEDKGVRAALHQVRQELGWNK
jgi:nitrate reductase NapAB chaperone NapD